MPSPAHGNRKLRRQHLCEERSSPPHRPRGRCRNPLGSGGIGKPQAAGVPPGSCTHTSARALKHKGSSQGLEPRVPSATSAPQVLLQGPQTAPSSPGADQAGTSAHNVQVLERVGSRHISDGGMWGRAHHPPRPGRRGGSRDPESQARLWCSGGGCIDEEVASRAACA